MAASSRRLLDFLLGFPQRIPARTPGPLGCNDHGDPTVTTLLGDTPGPLGWNDHGDPTLEFLTGESNTCAGPYRSSDGTALSVGFDGAEGDEDEEEADSFEGRTQINLQTAQEMALRITTGFE